MQISSPTQNIHNPLAAGQNGAPRESGGAEDVSGVWRDKRASDAARRRSSQGFFAKLLEGLTAKGKNGSKAEDAAETDGSKGTDGSEGAADLASLGITASKTAKDGKNVDAEELSALAAVDGESGSNAVLALLRNNAEADVEAGADVVVHAETADITPDGIGAEAEASRFTRRIHGLSSDALENSSSGRVSEAENGEAGVEQDFSSRLAAGSAEENAAGQAELTETEKLKALHAQAEARQRLSDGIFSGAHTQYAAGPGVEKQQDGDGGSSGNAREAEVGAARNKKSRFNVDFRDLRTGEEKDAGNAESVNNPAIDALGPEHGDTEIVVDLKLPGGMEAGGRNSGEIPQGRVFENALASQLRGDLSADIVQNATIIARNGGEGTIRLALHPASLGDVKIRLEMTENKITGLIVVESDEALRAFERELPVLEKAFRDSGFSETNLEMSLAQHGARDGWNFGAQDGRYEDDFSALSPLVAASRYDAESERLSPSDSVLSGLDGTVFAAPPGRTPVNMLV